jgi:hypothetical protein
MLLRELMNDRNFLNDFLRIEDIRMTLFESEGMAWLSFNDLC